MVYTINTGFVYLIDNDVKIGKLLLSVGSKYDTSYGLGEVSTKEEWDSLEVTPPSVPSDAQIASLKMQLIDIDSKSIRAIREGDTQRIASWEEQAEALREQIRQLEG